MKRMKASCKRKSRASPKKRYTQVMRSEARKRSNIKDIQPAGMYNRQHVVGLGSTERSQGDRPVLNLEAASRSRYLKEPRIMGLDRSRVSFNALLQVEATAPLLSRAE
jgi:hypothetical protein